MKPKASTLTSYEMSGGELHQNEHVDLLRACCRFTNSFWTCVTVRMFEVDSDSWLVFVSFLPLLVAWLRYLSSSLTLQTQPDGHLMRFTR